MSSKLKRKIARQNGAKAAGTKSPQGIQASSMNALRHGLNSKALVLSNESQTKFDELLQMYIDKFQPQDGVEMNLVTEMVAARWRQQRVWMIQTAALDLEMESQQIDIQEHESRNPPLGITEPSRLAMAFTVMANQEKTLELLMRYETSFSRMHDRAMKALFRLREEQNLRNDPKPSETTSTPDAAGPSQPAPGPAAPSAEDKVDSPKAPASQSQSPERAVEPSETNPRSVCAIDTRPRVKRVSQNDKSPSRK